MNRGAKQPEPLYRQIVEWVLFNIRNKTICPGEKIPTELELAERFGVSRGTVRTALNTLCKTRVLEPVQGSGYYVSNTQDVLEETRYSYAAIQAEKMIRELREQGLDNNEIRYYFRLAMNRMEETENRIKITVIECNPDILPVYHRQFRQIPGVEIDYCIIETGMLFHDCIDNADIIVTTPVHFRQVTEIRPDILGRIIRYNISISQKTLLAITALSGTERLGLACVSPRYAQMVQEALASFEISTDEMKIVHPGGLPALLREVDILILPAESPHKDEYPQEIQKFLERGGRILDFDYQIEKGSIAYIEEQVIAIASEKRRMAEKQRNADVNGNY